MISTEKGRLWRARNPERVKENRRLYYAANREKILAQANAYRAADPKKALARVYAWVAKNPDRVRANKQRWEATHPEERRTRVRNRRARKRAAEGTHTAVDIARIFAAQNGKCACCGARCKLTVDHIVPLAAGGGNAPRNLQGLCGTCNSSKGARDPIVFMQSNGMLL